MRGLEKTAKGTLRDRLGEYAYSFRYTYHEEGTGTKGVPDMSYSSNAKGARVNGWVEIKAIEKWPTRANTKVALRHFTPEQKHFLVSRGRLGGHCYMLLRIGTGAEAEWLLYDWTTVNFIGTLNKHQMILQSRFYCRNNLKGDSVKDLLRELTR